MPDEEWVKTLADGRTVKFIYQELPGDGAFMTVGNEVVYSVLLAKANQSRVREAAISILNSQTVLHCKPSFGGVGSRQAYPPHFLSAIP
jgi:hypothetical protein